MKRIKSDKKKDPICGMKGHIRAHDHYFCNESCVRKFEQKHNLKPLSDKHLKKQARPWYKNKIIYMVSFILILLVVSFNVPVLNPWFHAFIEYFNLIWWAVILGLLIGGFIDYMVPREYIEKYLGQHKKRTIFYAVGFGFLMSACSHGILAIAMELYKKGANTSSVVAFLLASPWANFPLTILFFSFFGPKALFIIFAAIFIAVTTGLIFQILEKNKMVECNKCEAKDHNFSLWKDVRKRVKNYKFDISRDLKGILLGAKNLSSMVMWWILIGMVIASAARAFIPQHIFMNYMGATALGMIVVLILATIIEVCSEGSAPMAFEIFKQTGAFGNSFVFLMAGVATDYTEIGLIWQNIGKKAAIWLPIITVPQIIIFGYLFNIMF